MADQTRPAGGTRTRTDTVRPQPSRERESTSRLILDRLAVVSRYRHLIVAAVLLAIVGALLKTYTTLPLYRAHATLLLDETAASVDVFRNSSGAWVDPEPFLETQYRVLQSRELALRVVELLGLAEAPELNGEGPEPPVLQAAFVSLQRAVTAALRRTVAGSARREPPAPAAPPSPNALAMAVLSRVRVTPVPNSHLVNVTFQSADPELAARAVNVLAEEYVRLNLEIKLASTDDTLTWLAEELRRQRATVEAAEHRLATYRETQNALSLDASQDIVTTRLQHLNDALTVAEATRTRKEALYDQILAVGVNSAAGRALPAVMQSAAVQDVRTRLAALEAELTWASQRYGAKHPEMVKLVTSIATATQELEGATMLAILSVRSEFEAALAEEQALRADLDAQKDTALELNRKSVDYGVLERDAESEQHVYETLLQREKELRIESHLQTNNVRVVDRATVPGAPFTPNTRGDLFLAIVLALIGSVGLAFGLNAIDDTLKTPEDVTKLLNVPFLGVTPAVPGERRPMLTDRGVPADFKEYYRALRTSLVFTVRTLPDHASRIVAVTSAQPLEGKTTTACNLAMVLTLGGARVLLIDGDMRRPSVHTAFGLRNGLGLSNMLAGQTSLRQAIHQTEDSKLYIMPAGHVPPNPAELLGSAEMVRAAPPIGESASRVPHRSSWGAERRHLGPGVVRLGHHRHAARARGDGRRDAHAIALRLGLRAGRRDDDPGRRRARAQLAKSCGAGRCGRGAQPRQLQWEQVLLPPLLWVQATGLLQPGAGEHAGNRGGVIDLPAARAKSACVGCAPVGDGPGSRCRVRARNWGGALAVPIDRRGAPGPAARTAEPGIRDAATACGVRGHSPGIRVTAYLVFGRIVRNRRCKLPRCLGGDGGRGDVEGTRLSCPRDRPFRDRWGVPRPGWPLHGSRPGASG